MYAVGLLVFVGAKIFIELSNRLNSLCIGTIPQNIVLNIKPPTKINIPYRSKLFYSISVKAVWTGVWLFI